MTLYLITFRSLTHAQRSARLLERSGLTAALIKTPPGLSSSGCSYAVTLRSRPEEALALLRKNNMRVGRLFRRGPDGSYEEAGA
ncbi:MAG: DUF3343 domain-containing protein [Oscillospiraceae bacterium]|nr:DUF3343 domain-containing protein [Oscillospiraceae bacterium]